MYKSLIFLEVLLLTFLSRKVREMEIYANIENQQKRRGAET